MATRQGTRTAFAAVTTLFFAWGFITSLIDPLVAAVKGIFSLTDVQAQLSASAFFIAYGVISLPAAVMIARRRSTTSIIIALAGMIAGCLIILAAANLATYTLVLVGLFVLASGITMLQVAANPLAAALGDPRYSHFRLTFSQAFNSMGTFIGPYLGATLFLTGLEVKDGAVVTEAARQNALLGIDAAYLWLGALILALLLFFLVARRTVDAAAPPQVAESPSIRVMLREALSSRWAVFGAAAIFIYVGAEVAIGTLMALFLNSDAIWGLSDAPRDIPLLARFLQLDDDVGVSLQEAGRAVALYWGGAMIGRIVGSALLTRFNAARLLALATATAALLCLFIAVVGGVGAGFVALSIGLFNSIVFPTIFTLTLERLSASASATSGLLCTAIVGGAVLPPLVGLAAQQGGYSVAFAVPAVCYILLCAFALVAARTIVSKPSQAATASIH